MSIMPTIIKQKGETRGRPKKNQVKALSGDYRKTFTQHMCVTYGLSLMYVMEIWAPTKDEKRIGHSEGAFTVYQKINDRYSYLTYAKDLQNWGFSQVLLNSELNRFCKTLIGSAPDFVFRQMVLIVSQFIQLKQKKSAKFALNEIRKIYCAMQEDDPVKLDQKFKYIRFSKSALSQMKSEKWADTISHKVRQLWPIFIDIFTYCIYCASEEVEINKFLKPLFSDASNPEDTLIGQLSLLQIINETERDEFQQSFRRSQSQNLSFTPYAPKFLERKEQKSPIISQNVNENKITTFNPPIISSFNSNNLTRKLVMPIIIKGGQNKDDQKSKKIDKKQSYLSVTSILNFGSNEKQKEDQREAEQQIEFQPIIFVSKESNQIDQENDQKHILKIKKKQSQQIKMDLQKEDFSKHFKQIQIQIPIKGQLKKQHEHENQFKLQKWLKQQCKCSNKQIKIQEENKQESQKQITKIEFQIKEESFEIKKDDHIDSKDFKKQKQLQKNNDSSQCDTKIDLASIFGRQYFNECVQKRFKNKKEFEDTIATGKSLDGSKAASKRQNNQVLGSKISIQQQGYSSQQERNFNQQHQISACQGQRMDEQHVPVSTKLEQITGTSINNDQKLKNEENQLKKIKRSRQFFSKTEQQQLPSSKPNKRVKLNE